MDHALPYDDDEIERRLLAKAVKEALEDPRPGVPHAVVRLKLLKKIGELQKKIVSIMEE